MRSDAAAKHHLGNFSLRGRPCLSDGGARVQGIVLCEGPTVLRCHPWQGREHCDECRATGSEADRAANFSAHNCPHKIFQSVVLRGPPDFEAFPPLETRSLTGVSGLRTPGREARRVNARGLFPSAERSCRRCRDGPGLRQQALGRSRRLQACALGILAGQADVGRAH